MNVKTAYCKKDRGFTIIEMVVSIGIFAFMTAFLVAKYGTFNQSVLLTNLAYDTAITIRNAQASALNVQGAASTTGVSSLSFTNAYGVHFGGATPVNQFVYYVNTAPTGSTPVMTYGPGTQTLTVYTYVRNKRILAWQLMLQHHLISLSSDLIPMLLLPHTVLLMVPLHLRTHRLVLPQLMDR